MPDYFTTILPNEIGAKSHYTAGRKDDEGNDVSGPFTHEDKAVVKRLFVA